eukprot:365091-Chlamydomonas_euryale.AAC.24
MAMPQVPAGLLQLARGFAKAPRKPPPPFHYQEIFDMAKPQVRVHWCIAGTQAQLRGGGENWG